MIGLKAGLVLAGCLAMAVWAAGSSLEGLWGGDRLRLVVDAGGAGIETDCASGRIAGPITLTPSGTFAASGTFDQHQGGPQRADVQPPPSSARYSGEVKGDLMTLSILPAGASAAQTFHLRKGAPVKLVRCL